MKCFFWEKEQGSWVNVFLSGSSRFIRILLDFWLWKESVSLWTPWKTEKTIKKKIKSCNNLIIHLVLTPSWFTLSTFSNSVNDFIQSHSFRCCLYAHGSQINISSPILSTKLQTRCQETEPCGYLITSETQFGHNKSLAFHPLTAKLFSPLIYPFLANVTKTPSCLSQKL